MIYSDEFTITTSDICKLKDKDINRINLVTTRMNTMKTILKINGIKFISRQDR